MTHDEHWAQLKAAHATLSGNHPRWTAAEVLACLASWAAEAGRQPASSEFYGWNELPDMRTVNRTWGSLQAVRAALGWAATSAEGRVTYRRRCLGCERAFTAAGRYTRLCESCKHTQEWEEDNGCWMGAGAVRDAWEEVLEWWEET